MINHDASDNKKIIEYTVKWRKKYEILINTLGTPEELPFDDQ